MAIYALPVQQLVDELGRLPGIGPKSAQRIAFHLLKLPTEDALRLASAIRMTLGREVALLNISVSGGTSETVVLDDYWIEVLPVK